jgi:hypothetical protein
MVWKSMPALPKLTLQFVFLLGGVCLMENAFLEITFQNFLCLFVIRKIDQRKTLFNQRKN